MYNLIEKEKKFGSLNEAGSYNNDKDFKLGYAPELKLVSKFEFNDLDGNSEHSTNLHKCIYYHYYSIIFHSSKCFEIEIGSSK